MSSGPTFRNAAHYRSWQPIESAITAPPPDINKIFRRVALPLALTAARPCTRNR